MLCVCGMLRHARTSRPSYPRCAACMQVAAQLLDLLRQYPSGLTEAVLATELLQRRLRKQARRGREACGLHANLCPPPPAHPTVHCMLCI